MKLDDKNIVKLLGISIPVFFVLIVGIIGVAGILDILSPRETFESLQYSATIVATYVGAILGFVFSKDGDTVKTKNKDVDDLKNYLRPLISLILSGALMLGLLSIALLLVFDKIPFEIYKTSSTVLTWVLTGFTSFIIGRYFGKGEFL